MLSLSLCDLGGLQHFAILLKYIIHVAIPDIPDWVADEMAKLEYRRREAFKVWLYHSLKDLRRSRRPAADCSRVSVLVPLYVRLSLQHSLAAMYLCGCGLSVFYCHISNTRMICQVKLSILQANQPQTACLC